MRYQTIKLCWRISKAIGLCWRNNEPPNFHTASEMHVSLDYLPFATIGVLLPSNYHGEPDQTDVSHQTITRDGTGGNSQ